MILLLIGLMLTVGSQTFTAAPAFKVKAMVVGDPNELAYKVIAHKQNENDVKIYCYVPALAVSEKSVLVRRMLRAYGIQDASMDQKWAVAVSLHEWRHTLMINAGHHPSNTSWGIQSLRGDLDKIVAQEEQASKPATASMPPAQLPAASAASDPLDTAAPDKTNNAAK